MSRAPVPGVTLLRCVPDPVTASVHRAPAQGVAVREGASVLGTAPAHRPGIVCPSRVSPHPTPVLPER
eukprot:3339690-Alexandrium_andersonii.AAC.1